MCVGGGILSHLTKQSCSGISGLLRKKFSGTVGRLQELGNFNCNTFPYQEEWVLFLIYEPGCNLFLNCREQLSTTPWWPFAADCARPAGWREKSVLGMETFEEELEPTKGQGDGGRLGDIQLIQSPLPLDTLKSFFNIFNEKYGHILFHWQLRDQPCINPLLCAPIYVFNHSSYEVENAQFCHSIHDCSLEILLHFFMLNLKFGTFLFVTLFSSFLPFHLKISHLGPRQY